VTVTIYTKEIPTFKKFIKDQKKAIPLQASTDPEGSRRLRLADL
jgi:hypothetical protein